MSLYEKSKAKEIIADEEELKKIVADTISTMAKSVGKTLGPGGWTVLIERDGLSPLITKDGVTVAKSLGVANAAANIVIESAKEICINTAKEAGDGTTTAIVIANALVKHGHTFMKERPKYNPQRLVTELHEVYESVIVPFLKNKAIPVKSEKQLEQVATISSNGDKKIAKAVVEAVVAAGDDGTVLIQEGQGDVMRVETIDGFIVTRGLKDLGQIGPVFINDNAGQQVNMDKGIIFLYDGKLNDLKPTGNIQMAIEGTELYGSPLIIMAHDFSDVVLDMLARNVKGGISIAPVKTPMSSLPNSRSMFLKDMAAYTGGTVYDPGNIEEASSEGFGHFNEAKVNMYETFIVTEPDQAAIEARVVELKAIGDAAFSDLDRMHINKNIACLTGGVSTIWVGGTSELEVREKKARVEDAVEAVRSAIAEGVIPGGCGVHMVLSDLLRRNKNKKDSWNIMADALEAPFDLLLTNCGEDVDVVKNIMSIHFKDKRSLPKKVFDAREHKIVDPFKKGIIEPAKVARVSIGNALSVASLLTTLGGIVVCPRDSNLEMQMEMQKQSFKDMMSTVGE